MTRFEDGPAKGKMLQLRRAARFLRVTEENGNFDALDQLEDEPRPGERIHVYEIHGETGMCHVSTRGRDGRRAGGFYAIANYRLYPVQPGDAVRNYEDWHRWCVEQAGGQP